MVAILFFLVPSGIEKGDMLMDWGTCKKLHWDVLILLGGGKFELWLFMLIWASLNSLWMSCFHISGIYIYILMRTQLQCTSSVLWAYIELNFLCCRICAFRGDVRKWTWWLVRKLHGNSPLRPILATHPSSLAPHQHCHWICFQCGHGHPLPSPAGWASNFHWTASPVTHGASNVFMQLFLHLTNCNTSKCHSSFHRLHQTHWHGGTWLPSQSCWHRSNFSAHANSRYDNHLSPLFFQAFSSDISSSIIIPFQISQSGGHTLGVSLPV